MATNYYLTEVARRIVERVTADTGGPLTMVIGGGCCDGTAPYLYNEINPEPHWNLVLQDELVSVYTSNLGPDAPGMDVVIDARAQISDSFSLESDYGYRLVVRLIPVN